MYNEKVIEIFRNPKNVGEIKSASGVGTVGNASCGDIMKLYIKIDDKEIIKDVKFQTFGCAAAIVSSSIATEMIKGKSVEEALNLDNNEIIKELGGLPLHKIHCSVLAKEAVEAAIKDYRSKKGKGSKAVKADNKKSESNKTAVKSTNKQTTKVKKVIGLDDVDKLLESTNELIKQIEKDQKKRQTKVAAAKNKK